MSDFTAELIQNASALASPGKGLLAADESTGTIGKRFDEIKLENSEDNRRAYRELLFRSAGWGQFCSGVILYDETIRQKAADGTPMVQLIKEAGVIPGIKLDKGTVPLPKTDGELATQGLDDLHKRCQEYYSLGARFAKWRAVLKITDTCPTNLSVLETSHTLARYAAICQANGLVPIVEPEILMDGNHSLEVSCRTTERVLASVFKALNDHHILLEGALLKPNMCLAGYGNSNSPDPVTVAKATVTVLQRTVPPALPGIMFLSGGQTEEQATLNLNAMNQLPTARPWRLSFSYGRALQQSTIKAWGGKAENVAAAQQEFLKRAQANSQAQLGQYQGGVQGAASNDSTFVAGYTY